MEFNPSVCKVPSPARSELGPQVPVVSSADRLSPVKPLDLIVYGPGHISKFGKASE